MKSEVVGPVNLVGGAMLAQVSLLFIMFIAGLLIRRSDRSARLRYLRTLASLGWLTLALALVTIGALGTTDAFSSIWLPLLQQQNWSPLLTWPQALAITFVLDIIVVAILVFATGGSRDSPFQSLYFLIPSLAIFLREPTPRVVLYVLLVAVLFSVTQVVAYDDYIPKRLTMWDESSSTSETRRDVAYWFVSVASFALAAVIGILTQPS